MYWSMTEGAFNCLIDVARTEAFGKAIAATVRTGDVVVDMGAGSGVLAMLAARAGAKKVYAIEVDRNNVSTLDAVFRANGLRDRIVTVHGDVRTVQLPEKVDVIIGEMIATALVEELQVPAVNAMLRFAKRTTRVLLNRYEIFCDLVANPANYYGFEFPLIRYEYPELRRLRSKSMTEKHLVLDVNFSRSVVDTKVKRNMDLTALKGGQVNGLRLSGETIFWDGSKLGATDAYNYPLILPIDPINIRRGDILNATISYRISGGIKTLKWAVKPGRGDSVIP